MSKNVFYTSATPTAYKITYEVMNSFLTNLVRAQSPSATEVYEGYSVVVEADSLWQALTLFGAVFSRGYGAEDPYINLQHDDSAKDLWSTDVKFNIVSVNPVFWYDEAEHWKPTGDFGPQQ